MIRCSFILILVLVLATDGSAQPPTSFDPSRRLPTINESSQQEQVQRKTHLYEPAKIVAWVGDQPIILGDLLGQVNQALAPYESQMTPVELEVQREALIKQALESAIDAKILYLEFLRKLPSRDKLAEISENVNDVFRKKQLPQMLKDAKVNTPGELDLYLRRFGSSLAKAQQSFMEQALAAHILQSNIDRNPEITHQEMVDHYREHAADYDIPAKVRYEQLMVRFDRFNSRDDAWNAIGKMGNQVLGGADLGAVARRSSHGSKADEGGLRDWTGKGSLTSKKLEKRLFELPLNKLSERIVDDKGIYIVRVLGRREPTKVPFVEAQVEIKKALRKEKIVKQQTEYQKKMRTGGVYVKTIFDKPDKPRTATSKRGIN